MLGKGIVYCTALVILTHLSQASAEPNNYDEDEFGTEVSLVVGNQSQAKTSQSGTSFGFRTSTISVDKSMPLGDRDSLFIGFEAQKIDIDTKAVLPGTTTAVPKSLSGANFLIGWDHEMANDMNFGVEVSAGSLSDKPFKGSDSISYQVETSLMIPSGRDNAWILGIGYSNEDGEVSPSFAYQWRPNDNFTALIGLPFAEFEWLATDRLEVSGVVSDSDSELSANYHLTEDTSIFASYGKTGWSARRFGRTDKKALLNYEQTVAAIGVSHSFQSFDVSLSAGRSEKGELSESRDDAPTGVNRLKIEDSNFVLLSISTGF